jgi:hypothetical protein
MLVGIPLRYDQGRPRDSLQHYMASTLVSAPLAPSSAVYDPTRKEDLGAERA